MVDIKVADLCKKNLQNNHTYPFSKKISPQLLQQIFKILQELKLHQ